MKKTSLITVLLFTAILTSSISAPAHVTVKPATAKPASYETFNISVPNESQIPMTKIKLEIPTELESVRPTQKAGWTVNISKEGQKTQFIEWTGGTIKPDLRDDFTFSTKTPATDTKLNWKATQTFEDGSTKEWNKAPSADGHSKESSPYSVTEVKAAVPIKEAQAESNLPLIFAVSSLLISVATMLFGFVKIRKN